MNTSESSKPVSTLQLTWRAVQVRLRFVAVLLAAFVVVGNWDSLRNRGETFARRVFGAGLATSDEAVSTDTEYFCPMDPGILSMWPGRCGACNMALVRRKKGEASPRPDGVIARMQFSPYRVQLAGLRTAPVSYRPLAREVTGVGLVVESAGRSVARASFFESDLPALAVGRSASIVSEGGQTSTGRVLKLDPPASCLIEVDDTKTLPRPGSRIVAKVRVPVAEMEPFCALPSNALPLRKEELTELCACPEHPDALQEKSGRCAIDRNVRELRKLAGNQRVGWWCPIHPGVTSDASGSTCKPCNGMPLVPRVISYRPAGQVLAIPESAVVDTGIRKVAFLERMEGMFDAVEIVTGPRCGGDYPVFSGLAEGDRVATSGALLIDAETRLNPSLAASYFGATTQAAPPRSEARPPAETCPVTGKPLGSMGAPVRVAVDGKTVWLCCSGCEARLRKTPAKYLGKPADRE
jgi:hypothetical protein